MGTGYYGVVVRRTYIRDFVIGAIEYFEQIAAVYSVLNPPDTNTVFGESALAGLLVSATLFCFDC